MENLLKTSSKATLKIDLDTVLATVQLTSLNVAFNGTGDRVKIIEDSLTGLRSAISSGAHVIAKTGSTPIEKLSHIHHIIDHLDEITVNFLEEILQKTK